MIIVVVLVVIGSLVGVYYFGALLTPTFPPTRTPQTRPHYLTYYPSHLTYGGNVTKVLLLDSKLRYGVYEHDFQLQMCEHGVKKGDPCVIVTATIRNDYEEEWPHGYFISLTVYLYNTKGELVPAPVMTYGQLFCGMVEVNLRRGETTTVDIYVAYDKQDIDHYELYIFNIQNAPTP